MFYSETVMFIAYHLGICQLNETHDVVKLVLELSTMLPCYQIKK